MSLEDDVIALEATYREKRATAEAARQAYFDAEAEANKAHNDMQTKVAEWRSEQIATAAEAGLAAAPAEEASAEVAPVT